MSLNEKEPFTISRSCKIVVPGTFIVCGEGNWQYCSDECLKLAQGNNKDLLISNLRKELDAALAELNFIKKEYGEASNEELTEDALRLKLTVLEQENLKLKEEIKRLK